MDGVWKPKLFRTLNFNGKTSYVAGPALDLSKCNEFTFVSLVKMFTIKSCQFISLNYGFYQGYTTSTNTYETYIKSANGIIYSNRHANTLYTPNYKALNFVISTFDGENLDMYINGNLYKHITIPEIKLINTLRTAIGSSITYSTAFVRGYIPLTKVFNIALSKSQIKYLCKHPFSTVDEEHLVLDLNPAGINIANGKWWDLSGKGNDGTIYNATEVKLIEEEVSAL